MKTAIISIFLTAILVGGLVGLMMNGSDTGQDSGNNISIVDGKQIIEIRAKGGYSPRSTTAQANIPTVIKVKTRGTFDCSSALVIPGINYRENLLPSGETLIELPPQKSGSILQGLCAMGMYNFSVKFN